MFRILKNKILKSDKTIESKFVNLKLTKSLDKNIDIFKKIFNKNDTIKFRMLENYDNKLKCCIIFNDGMIKPDKIHEGISKPIINSKVTDTKIDTVLNKILYIPEGEISNNIDEMVSSVLYGDTVILVDKNDKAIIADTKGWQTRAISQPETEVSLKGPKEGFTESIIMNLSLIRRKIVNPDLKFVFRELGRVTKTKICICYIEGIASDKILRELNERLNKIDIDGILAAGYIEELIKDAPLSPFQTTGYTERPDVVAGNLLEGRIAIVIDGTPVVITLPFIFMEYFQANEDYYQNFIFSSINRIMRFIAFFLTTSIPAIYVALVTYHQEMIPTPLIISIFAAREGIPFPTVFEALAMLFAFEIMREAGVRLPRPIGQSISIVGALILGEAAVTARLISAPMVIITALTGISAFLIPKMLGPLIIVRTVFLILASFLGLYGYIFGVIGLFIHLMSMRSFGVPYMLNMGSINKQDIKDTVIRAPWWYMYYRPKLISDKNSARKGDAKR